MGEVGICGAGHDFAADFLEFGYSVGEGDDFGGADEGEVQWVEEEDHVFAGVLFQREVFDKVVVDDSGG